MGFKLSNKINYELFTKNYTPESVYVLGLLWADGYVSKTSNSISIECIKEDIEYFFPIFQTTGSYNLNFRKRGKRKEQGTINCSSLHLANFLKENDYLIKSETSPTKIISFIPENLHNFFFLGWLDGDGCFYHNERKTMIQFIVSGSYNQNWYSLEFICNKLNIDYRIDRFKTKNGNQHSRFLINKNEDILTFGEFIYNNNSIGLPRKRKKFDDIKKYINNRKSIRILCYTRCGKLVNEFMSLKLASDWLNKGKYVGGCIKDCIKGRQPTAYNYIWKKIKIEELPTH